VNDYETGTNVRCEVLGDSHVDRVIANTTDLTGPFQDFITRYAWGAVRARDGLDCRTRSMITIAILTALGREQELALHIRGARTNGLTPPRSAKSCSTPPSTPVFHPRTPLWHSPNGSSPTRRSRIDDEPRRPVQLMNRSV
jgi:alkylhydroperoxidase/carboxymuconolactone decarboxylase family protein YurZ